MRKSLNSMIGNLTRRENTDTQRDTPRKRRKDRGKDWRSAAINQSARDARSHRTHQTEAREDSFLGALTESTAPPAP